MTTTDASDTTDTTRASRPVTLFTGQWADLPFEEVARLAGEWGYDGLEIACWDMVGKDRGRPVHAMIGGRVNDRVRTYTYLYPTRTGHALPGFWADPAQAAEAAEDAPTTPATPA